MNCQSENQNFLSENEDFISLDKFYNQIYIINLKHRTDRWNKMVENLKLLNIQNYQRFEAINGLETSIKNFWHYNKIHNKNYKVNSPGALGYLLSYYHILIEAQERKYQQILVLDDDIILHKDYKKFLSTYIHPKKFKLIYYGVCHQLHNQTFNHSIITKPDKLEPSILNIRTFKNLFGSGNIDGSFMMGISYQVFNELIIAIKNSLLPFDSGPLRTLYNKFPYECFIFYPNLVIQDMTDSDIQNFTEDDNLNYQKKKKLISHWGWKLDEYQIQ